MRKLEEPILTLEEIKKIVEDTLGESENSKLAQNEHMNLFSELMAKRKISIQKGPESLQKKSKLFSHLGSYIDFEEIFFKIKQKLEQKAFEKKQNETLKKLTPRKRFSNQIALIEKPLLNQQAQKIQEKIEIQCKTKFNRIFKSYVSNIEDLLEDLETKSKFGNGVPRTNEILLTSLQSMNRRHIDKENLVWNLEGNEIWNPFLAKTDEKEKQEEKISFSRVNEEEMEAYEKDVLALLAIIIERERKKNTCSVVRQSKIKNVWQSKSQSQSPIRFKSNFLEESLSLIKHNFKVRKTNSPISTATSTPGVFNNRDSTASASPCLLSNRISESGLEIFPISGFKNQIKKFHSLCEEDYTFKETANNDQRKNYQDFSSGIERPYELELLEEYEEKESERSSKFIKSVEAKRKSSKIIKNKEKFFESFRSQELKETYQRMFKTKNKFKNEMNKIIKALDCQEQQNKAKKPILESYMIATQKNLDEIRGFEKEKMERVDTYVAENNRTSKLKTSAGSAFGHSLKKGLRKKQKLL